jgi:FkbM family methyltransferase
VFIHRYKERIRRLLPRKLKQHRILGGPLKGSLIFTSWHDYPGAILGTTELPLVEWFRKYAKAGETWLDVGAHYGYTAIALSKLVGKCGRVIAFEPVLATAACMSRTRMLNGLRELQVVPVGLSAAPALETKRLGIVRGMADSMLSRDCWMEAILVSAFDHIWSTLSEGVSTIDGVKIDVQGMECEVLRGMRQALSTQHPKLVVEFHEGVDRREILDLLRDCGYRSAGEPIDGSEDAGAPLYQDNKSYAFFPAA